MCVVVCMRMHVFPYWVPRVARVDFLTPEIWFRSLGGTCLFGFVMCIFQLPMIHLSDTVIF
jgi:hypothetical protein